MGFSPFIIQFCFLFLCFGGKGKVLFAVVSKASPSLQTVIMGNVGKTSGLGSTGTSDPNMVQWMNQRAGTEFCNLAHEPKNYDIWLNYEQKIMQRGKTFKRFSASSVFPFDFSSMDNLKVVIIHTVFIHSQSTPRPLWVTVKYLGPPNEVLIRQLHQGSEKISKTTLL